MKIAITGATGFVGAALCRFFSNLGNEVVAFGRSPAPPAGLLSYASYRVADIRFPIAPLEADVCIHAAALASIQRNYHPVYLANVVGTHNVLKAARQCRFFVLISSSSVYDFQTSPVKESDAHLSGRLSNYGKTKLLAEELVIQGLSANQNRLILRPRAVYGLGDRTLLPQVLKLIKGNRILCPAPAFLQTSMTHIDNLCEAIHCYLHGGEHQLVEVYNIADQQPYFLRDVIVDIAEKLAGKPIKTINIPLPWTSLLAKINAVLGLNTSINHFLVQTLRQHTVLDTTRLQATKGFLPRHQFNNTSNELVRWIGKLGGTQQYLRQYKRTPWKV